MIVFVGLTVLILGLGYPFYSELLKLKAVKESKQQFETTILESTRRDQSIRRGNTRWESLPVPIRETLSKFGFSPATIPEEKSSFSLETPDGKTVSLQQYRGSWVILNFWATWCPPCRTEMPSLDKLQSSFKTSRLIVSTVNVQQSVDTVEQFKRNYGIDLPVLLDTTGTISQHYGLTGLPETWLISPAGRPLAKIEGPLNWHNTSLVKTLKDLVQLAPT